jgi:ribonuclease BN (tRNA processing enzyme)
MNVNIRLLGTGSSIPSANRLPSSCVVKTDRGKFLIDAGPSIVHRLLKYGYSLNDIDVIFLTHFHPDHTVDLATFLFSCNYGGPPRTKPLTIIGGNGIKEFMERMTLLYPWITPAGYELTITALPQGKHTINGILIETVTVNHREESIAIRLEDNGKGFVYSGDMDLSPSFAELVQSSDMVIAECTYPAQKEKGHLNLATLSCMIDCTRSRQVILTHLDPQWDAFHASLPEPFLLGEDGMEIDI